MHRSAKNGREKSGNFRQLPTLGGGLSIFPRARGPSTFVANVEQHAAAITRTAIEQALPRIFGYETVIEPAPFFHGTQHLHTLSSWARPW
jgi:hypothetical protein